MPSRSNDGRPQAAQLAARAREELAQLTGREAEAVLAIERAEDDAGGWLVEVEVVELRRVPTSTDVLACYVARMNDDGSLLEYKRRGRYVRAQAEGEGT